MTLTSSAAFGKLDARDRCDRCQAQSVVAVLMTENGLRLDFCRHHFNKVSGGLMLNGRAFMIVDERR